MSDIVSLEKYAFADLVTVFHCEENYQQTLELHQRLQEVLHYPVNLIGVDNRDDNIGFAAACNRGSLYGDTPIIGFLNPDCIIHAPFLDDVIKAFSDHDVVIAGNRFNKPERELKIWGVREWVCGAAFFVRRSFWTLVGGFDQQFVWGWEETDLIRTAESMGKQVKNLNLPISHASPDNNSDEDVLYKNLHFNRGAERFYRKWGQ